MDRWILPTEHLTQVHPLPGISLRDPLYFTMGFTDEPGRVLAWFNASSVVHNGKRWMAYRTECKRWFIWSRISLVQLDEAFKPIPGTNVLLPLKSRFDGWGVEDPRLFVFDGSMFLTYGDGYRVLLAQLNDKGEILRCSATPADEPDQNPPQRHHREKNWGFFEYDGKLFCQQNVSPAVTWEFDPKTWTVINRWSVPWRWHSSFGEKLHGGAPPIFYDGLLWRWVHCHRTEKLPVPRKSWFNEKPQMTGHRYYPHLAAFAPKPPFEPVAVSSVPIFHTQWEPPQSDGPTHYSVAYIGSSERENDGWRLFYGENDCRIATAYVDHELIKEKLKDVERPVIKKVRPTYQNFLHFIWMQGEDQLPIEDERNINEWKAMNKDWEVKIWDDDSLAHLIKTKAPEWETSWEELAYNRETQPDNTALTAKASDMARLIILSLRFGHNQAWNVYADTDTKPCRPLTDFINDDTLYGGNITKAPSFSGSVAEKPWDIDNYDLLVSEENLQTPGRGYMTNAVMMCRPEAKSISAILKAGALTQRRPTLQAWGPIMLRRAIEALKRTPDGRRIYMLPFHYFVWNPAQMLQVVPSWTVCTHHNAFRWHQPGVRSSMAGANPKRRSLLV